MKAMFFTSNLYNDTSNSNFKGCSATDYVFTPMQDFRSITDEDAKKMAMSIKSLLAVRGGKTTNIWIGTPSVNDKNAWLNYTADQLLAFVKNVYAELDSYQNKVAGVYMNQEAIYGDMDYNNVLGGTQIANKQIRIMKQIRDKVKTGIVHGTQFLWCPYYGRGDDAATIIKKLGHVVDKVQIFDYVLLQPNTIFHNSSATNGNLDGVKHSVNRNKVCYRNDVYVIASKVSNTAIGYVMEYVPGNSVFDDYKTAFASCKNKPWMFYWQHSANPNIDGLSSTVTEINNWC